MRYLTIITTFLISLSAFSMGLGTNDIKLEERKIKIHRSDFIDAQDQKGDVLIYEQLGGDEARLTSDSIIIDPSSTNLIDVQLQDGRIINLDRFKAIDPGNGGAGGGGF